MQHSLKTWPEQFSAVLHGRKRYEIRTNDRNFQEGDELMLREWDPKTQRYSGRHILTTVTYITRGGEWNIPENLCIMSLAIQYWNIEATA